VSVRRIYPADAQWAEGAELTQKVWELDLFTDDEGYLYSILVLFGLELAIHLGDPDIDGYRRWLLRNGGVSPLYSGRYSGEMRTYAGVHSLGAQRAVIGYIERR
jgi:hypothetical protein